MSSWGKQREQKRSGKGKTLEISEDAPERREEGREKKVRTCESSSLPKTMLTSDGRGRRYTHRFPGRIKTKKKTRKKNPQLRPWPHDWDGSNGHRTKAMPAAKFPTKLVKLPKTYDEQGEAQGSWHSIMVNGIDFFVFFSFLPCGSLYSPHVSFVWHRFPCNAVYTATKSDAVTTPSSAC